MSITHEGTLITTFWAKIVGNLLGMLQVDCYRLLGVLTHWMKYLLSGLKYTSQIIDPFQSMERTGEMLMNFTFFLLFKIFKMKGLLPSLWLWFSKRWLLIYIYMVGYLLLMTHRKTPLFSSAFQIQGLLYLVPQLGVNLLLGESVILYL